MTITADGEDFRVQGVFIGDELPASNGVIHVIDGVLIPPPLPD